MQAFSDRAGTLLVQRHVDQRPCGWHHVGQLSGLCLGLAVAPEHARGARKPCRHPPARPCDHADGDARGDFAPAVPAIELDHVVGPHQPDKAHTRIEPLQGGKGVAGHARAQLRLDPGDLDMRVMDDVARLRDAFGQGCRAMRLEGVAGRHQPPDPVQPEPPQRHFGDMDMALMRGIEGSAQEAHPHPGQRDGKPGAHSEQPLHLSMRVKPDPQGGGFARQARHGHDLAADRDDKARASGKPHLAHRDR